LRQHGRLQTTKFWPRVKTELVAEDAAGLLELAEGIRLAARAVQGEHELGATPLPQRLCVYGFLELSDDLGVMAEG
jgi:hypothetical protein